MSGKRKEKRRRKAKNFGKNPDRKERKKQTLRFLAHTHSAVKLGNFSVLQ